MEQNRFLIIFRKYPYIAGGVIASLCLLGLIVRVSQNIPKKKLALEDLEKKIRHYEVDLNAASGIDADSLALKAIVEGIDPLLISPKDTTKLFSFFLDLERRTQVKMDNPVLLEIATLASQKFTLAVTLRMKAAMG